MLLMLFLNSFDLLNFPESIKYMGQIRLIFSFFQKSFWSKIITTQILVIFCMNKIDNIMIFYIRFVNFHLELVMNYEFEHTFGNVLINN
jgi:hypothetical protein